MSATPTSTPTFGTQLIGQTEKAMNTILDRLLAPTGLTEHQWVTLTLTVAGGGSVDRAQLIGRVAGGLKVSEADANARIGELAAAGLLRAADGEGSPVTITDAGRTLHDEIRAAVTPVTERLWGDLPAEDLAVTGRVLGTILARANEELAGA
jgi:DNA-binding MarR family transcriptional regulator